MKLTKYFKLFESRTSDLSEEEFFSILKENCKEFLNDPKCLQRVKNKFGSTYAYIDPKIHNRTDGSNRNVAKNLLLLLDNLPSWKDYPKRNNSIIATSGHTKNSIYGRDYYILIPFDGAKFGVVPCQDLWSCKLANQNIYGNSIGALVSSMDYNNIINSNYADMIKDIQRIYDTYEKDGLVGWSQSLGRFFDGLKRLGIEDIEDGLNDIFDPNKITGYENTDTFRVSTYSDLVSNGNEIWTDSKCLVYNLGHFSGEIINIDETFNNFIEKMNSYENK